MTVIRKVTELENGDLLVEGTYVNDEVILNPRLKGTPWTARFVLESDKSTSEKQTYYTDFSGKISTTKDTPHEEFTVERENNTLAFFQLHDDQKPPVNTWFCTFENKDYDNSRIYYDPNHQEDLEAVATVSDMCRRVWPNTQISTTKEF